MVTNQCLMSHGFLPASTLSRMYRSATGRKFTVRDTVNMLLHIYMLEANGRLIDSKVLVQ